MFANTIVLRTNLSGDPTKEVLRRVRQVTLMPIETKIFQSRRSYRPPIQRSVDRNFVSSEVILQNVSPKALALPGLSAHFVDVDPGTAQFARRLNSATWISARLAGRNTADL
jgi:hypothetical protein